MVHARDDYNRIQDPAVHDPSLLGKGSTPIGEDEPVILFRAQDRNFQAILRAYERLLREDPKQQDQRVVTLIQQQIIQAERWQATHKVKSPDFPKG